MNSVRWPARIAVAVTLAVALGTPLFAYSAWLFSEPLAMSLLIGAALAAFGDSGPVSASRAALAGALLGACLLVRPGHAIAAPVFVAAVLVRDRRRGENLHHRRQRAEQDRQRRPGVHPLRRRLRHREERLDEGEVTRDAFSFFQELTLPEVSASNVEGEGTGWPERAR